MSPYTDKMVTNKQNMRCVLFIETVKDRGKTYTGNINNIFKVPMQRKLSLS